MDSHIMILGRHRTASQSSSLASDVVAPLSKQARANQCQDHTDTMKQRL